MRQAARSRHRVLALFALAALAGAAAAAPPRAASAAGAGADGGTTAPPQRCASGPRRDDYVSLRANDASSLAAAVAECERLGYRRVGGVARAVVANPGAPSAERYFQVMIVPAGASSAPPGTASAAR